MQQKVANVNINKQTTPALIMEILSYELPKEAEQCVREQITIRNRMLSYLKQTPSKILPQEKDCQDFQVDFQLQNINLRGIYHLDTHTIQEMQYVIKKPDKEKTLSISKAGSDEPLVFPLQEEYQETLAYISNNAKSYLGLFNKARYEEYEKLLASQD